jgi:hypothetical protein
MKLEKNKPRFGMLRILIFKIYIGLNSKTIKLHLIILVADL